MNFLVTGGAGYIGSHFAKLASRAGHRVVVLDNLSTGHRKFIRFGPLEEVDLLETQRVIDVLQRNRIDAVFHFAGSAIISESIALPEKYFRNNVEATQSLLEAMRVTGVSRLIFSSSAVVYGNANSPRISEEHPRNPIHPYGESKLRCEELILAFAYQDQRRKVAVLRYFNVVGGDPDGELWEEHDPETHLLPNLLVAARGHKDFEIFGGQHETPDGTCIRDFIDVNDLVSAHLEALGRLEIEPILVSNLGSGRGYSILEVVREVEGICGTPVRTVIKPARAGDPPRLVAAPDFFRSWSSVTIRPLAASLRQMMFSKARSLSS